MDKLCIIMVGLPASGKSTVAMRLCEGLEAEGLNVRIFNNGALRRTHCGGDSANPEFYDPSNLVGLGMREQIARISRKMARQYLEERGDIAIIDATNASRARRVELEVYFRDYPIVFVECWFDDPEILELAIGNKAKLPEFSQLPFEDAVSSFKKRISYYRQIFTPLGAEACFFRVDSLRNRIIEEKFDRRIPYYIPIRNILVSDWVRELYLIRHGESMFNIEGRVGGDSSLTPKGHQQAEDLAEFFQDKEVLYIFTSHRKRSIETSRPIMEKHPKATCIPLQELDEINAGDFDSMTYDEIRAEHPGEFEARARDKYNYVYPNGEGYATLRKRVGRGLRKALFLSGGRPGTLIIGHQAINRMILSYFLYRRRRDVPYIYVPQNRLFHIIATYQKKVLELIPLRRP